ncbi:hypothetical protein NHX12_020743 [Muraenolepis orangiensis]|uniref:Uncharacterized protein n=1 Tax=Muraenolepis orangiensis TaxID=630683 RepID=A0A9Q0EVV1_9TELE|nr:hypothetical protein NHX12_020743 [Muraenolepis orangiensis]
MLTFSLTFIRHGETQYNRDKLLQGQGVDTSLSETGLRQAEAVGQYLRDLRFNVVYTSDLQRTCQTTEQILKNSTYSGMVATLEPLLRERGFGIAEGRHKQDLKNMANSAGQSCRDFTPQEERPSNSAHTHGSLSPVDINIIKKCRERGRQYTEFIAFRVLVRLRFKDFLNVVFKWMMEEHSDAAAASSGTTSTTTTGPPRPAGNGSPEEGLEGVGVHVLAVSHGAYIRVGVQHLLEDLGCEAPVGARASQLLSACPNTGVTRFVLTLRQGSVHLEKMGGEVDEGVCHGVNDPGWLESGDVFDVVNSDPSMDLMWGPADRVGI